jgi:hypothetical protein
MKLVMAKPTISNRVNPSGRILAKRKDVLESNPTVRFSTKKTQMNDAIK